MSIQEGTQIPAWSLASVDAAKMKTMAMLLADSNPIHFDVAAVRALGLGERTVNQGPSNVGYLINMITAWTGSAASVQSLRVRFLGNVFSDSTVVASGTVTSIEEIAGRRLATCQLVLTTNDVAAVTGTAVVDVTDIPREQ